jgi:hypothetical protein
MEQTSKHVCWLAALIGMLAVGTAAQADSTGITLSRSTLSGTAGSTLTFAATLTNISTSTVFLNGDSSTTVTPGLVVSDNPFLTNAPPSLDDKQFVLFWTKRRVWGC